MNFNPFCKTDICFCSKSQLVEVLAEIQEQNILLILSSSAQKRWGFEELPILLAKNHKLVHIKSVSPNPTQLDIQQALEIAGCTKPDIIIAFGGGSAIDLAKAVSAFYDEGSVPGIEDITKELETQQYKQKTSFIPIVAVPSTAGTGSEITQWATIWDVDKRKKYSIDAPGLAPVKAVVCAELTLGMDPKLTLATGLDALSHATEAYWAKATNPLVQQIAYRAIQIILESLPKAVENANDLDVREKLCLASVLAGIAFSHTRTTACHSISYPMTMLYNVPHGFAASITLDGIAKLNRDSFAKDKDLFELFDCHGGLKKWMDNCCRDVLTLRLSAFGIKEQDIPVIVDNSFTAGRMDNNPAPVSREQVTAILEFVL